MTASCGGTPERRGTGAVAGGVVGLLVMGPVGAVAGASGGGLMGWLSGKAVGIPEKDVASIKEALKPNSSAHGTS